MNREEREAAKQCAKLLRDAQLEELRRKAEQESGTHTQHLIRQSMLGIKSHTDEGRFM